MIVIAMNIFIVFISKELVGSNDKFTFIMIDSGLFVEINLLHFLPGGLSF